MSEKIVVELVPPAPLMLPACCCCVSNAPVIVQTSSTLPKAARTTRRIALRLAIAVARFTGGACVCVLVCVAAIDSCCRSFRLTRLTYIAKWLAALNRQERSHPDRCNVACLLSGSSQRGTPNPSVARAAPCSVPAGPSLNIHPLLIVYHRDNILSRVIGHHFATKIQTGNARSIRATHDVS